MPEASFVAALVLYAVFARSAFEWNRRIFPRWHTEAARRLAAIYRWGPHEIEERYVEYSVRLHRLIATMAALSLFVTLSRRP